MHIDCKSIVDPLMDALMVMGRGHLAVISVGDDPASQAYVRGKKKDCDRLGFGFSHYRFRGVPDDMESAYQTIETLNKNPEITGIILQLPTPWGEAVEQTLIECIAPEKDVDGFLPESVFSPCTPEGICYLLKHEMGTLDGKVVCMVGRGRLVGAPMAAILQKENATPILCNSHTERGALKELIWASDAAVFATGQDNWFDLWNENMPTSVVYVDCGCFRGEDGTLHGELFNNGFYEATPVPGGVGLLTRLALMVHVAGFESIKAFVEHVKFVERRKIAYIP